MEAIAPGAGVPLAGRRMHNIKSHNMRAVLLTLLHERATSRVGIAQLTQLSTTTLTNIVEALIAQGIVAEEGREATPGNGAGRPPTLLRLVPEARYAVGVHIGVSTTRVGVVNLAGQLQHYHVASLDVTTPVAQALDQIAEQVNQALRETGVAPERVVGVGVGASGLVDVARGVNVLAPNLGWRDLPLREELARRLALPVTVDNNVRAMALAEALFGAGRSAKTLAFVYGRIGVGAGFVTNGRLSQHTQAAGEIGHMTIVPSGGALCQCGNTGCLETMIAEPELLRRAHHLAARAPDSPLATLLAGAAEPQAEHIFAAARQGDQNARAILSDCAFYLGLALANLINLLTPDVIILGGLFAMGQDVLLPEVETVMRQRSFANLGQLVQLRATSSGAQIGAIGAATLALDAFFYQSAGVQR
jgi:glucokinase-like ROK family protein